MDLQIIIIYCVCSDFLSQTEIQNTQCQMSDAEVVTIVIVSAMFFHGHHTRTRHFLSFMDTFLICLVKVN